MLGNLSKGVRDSCVSISEADNEGKTRDTAHVKSECLCGSLQGEAGEKREGQSNETPGQGKLPISAIQDRRKSLIQRLPRIYDAAPPFAPQYT